MTVKVFILGLPGSGKSTISRYISSYAEDKPWSTIHINDYDILYQMYREDTQGEFKPADEKYGGFDVVDIAAFDIALRKLEQQVDANISKAQLEDIVLIEFSRNDYRRAFHQFSQKFLQNAFFLYLNVDLDICKKRIRERIADPDTPHNHFVSEYIFEEYYNRDDGNDLPQILRRNFGINKERVRVIDNKGSPEEIATLIDRFVDAIFPLETYRLQDTEPIQEIKDEEVEGELEQNSRHFDTP